MAADLTGAHRKTIAADKCYDTNGFAAEMRCLDVTSRVAQHTNRPGGSAIDRRTSRHQGHARSSHAPRGCVIESSRFAPQRSDRLRD